MKSWPKAKFNDQGWQLKLLVTISVSANVLSMVGSVAIKFPDILNYIFKNCGIIIYKCCMRPFPEVKCRSSGKTLQKKAADAVVTFGYDHRKHECFLLHVWEYLTEKKKKKFPHNKRLRTWPCRGRKSQCYKLASPESQLPGVVLSRFSRGQTWVLPD